jgi:hypothetical protein
MKEIDVARQMVGGRDQSGTKKRKRKKPNGVDYKSKSEGWSQKSYFTQNTLVKVHLCGERCILPHGVYTEILT